MILQRLGILQVHCLYEPRLIILLNIIDFIEKSREENDWLTTAILTPLHQTIEMTEVHCNSSKKKVQEMCLRQ